VKDIIDGALAIPGQLHPRELARLYWFALQTPSGLPMVELGTFQGRTAAMLCAAANKTNSEVVTIDDYTQDQAFGSKSPKEYAEMTTTNLAALGFEPRIIIGDSATVPAGIEQVGLLFIDSEHTPERFNAECDAWLPLLVGGGILACHDYNCPIWAEMTPTINERIGSRTDEWEYLGLEIWLIGFRHVK